MTRMTLASRLWLAWRVIRGQLVSASWTSYADEVSLHFADTRALRKRWKESA
jgi:hypothetical protein